MPVSGFVFFFSSSVTSFLNENLTENTLIMLSYLWGPLLQLWVLNGNKNIRGFVTGVLKQNNSLFINNDTVGSGIIKTLFGEKNYE
jgi:hypothetical protein